MSSAPEDLEPLAGMARLTGVPVAVHPGLSDRSGAFQPSRGAAAFDTVCPIVNEEAAGC